MRDDLAPHETLTALPTATSRVGEASGVLSDETPLRSGHREGKMVFGKWGILCDREIKHLAFKDGMISPFVDHLVSKKLRRPELVGGPSIISYGLGSYGYDVRASTEFKVFTNLKSTLIDPKRFNEDVFVDVVCEEGDPLIIPPNSFALSSSLEYIKVPRDILVITIGKSTYARCGINTNVTPLEPEWEGNITIEIANGTPLPVAVYPLEGICQLVFHRVSEECEVSYADRSGKYQGQSGVVLAKV